MISFLIQAPGKDSVVAIPCCSGSGIRDMATSLAKYSYDSELLEVKTEGKHIVFTIVNRSSLAL